MLNEEQIKLMTKVATYEKRGGKKHIEVSKYFRSDYIMMQMIKTIIAVTIAFGTVIGLYILYDFELLLEEVYDMDLLTLGQDMLIAYIVTMGVFILITYIVYSIRYQKTKLWLKRYHADLRKIAKFHGKEEKE
ncbi:MAG: hypothetical protein R3Y24_07735 [Eubacteriales bacterium]